MRLKVVSVLFVSAGLSAAASASTLDLKFNSLVHGTSGTPTVKVSAKSGILPGTRTSLTVYAGPQNHETRNGTGRLASASSIIRTFCTELSQTVKSSWYTFDGIAVEDAPRPASGSLTGGMGQEKADAIRLLWAGVGSTMFTDPLVGAAVQIAIWEIVYDGPAAFNLNYGDVSFSNNSDAINEAQNLFETFETYVWDTQTDTLMTGTLASGLIALSSDYSQDQLYLIPLPAQGAMAFAGLLGIGAIRRRRI